MSDVATALRGLIVNGMLLPENVVAAAAHPDSPLHSHFEWDDSEAAIQWRLTQARRLIRSVVIEHGENTTTEIRAYVSLPADRASGVGYRTIEEVMSSDFLRQQLMAEILEKIEMWEKKAEALGMKINFKSVRQQVKKRAG